MRKITKSLMTLALLVLGVTSANAGDKRMLVKEFDFSVEGYNFYRHTDFANTLTVADGGLKIVNPVEKDDKVVEGDKAMFVADWMIPNKGASYVAVFTYKSTVAGTANLSMDPWGAGASSTVTLAVSDDFTTAEATFTNYPNEGHNNQYGGDTHIIMNIGSMEGTIILQKVQVYQLVPEAPVASTGQDGWLDNMLKNADFTGDDWSSFQAKPYIINADETVTNDIGNPVIEDGAIKVVNDQKKTIKMKDGEPEKDQWGNQLYNENDWNAQFWIIMPKAMPVGTKLLVKFDCKADKAGKASTQTHKATPGDYIHWACIGDVNFTTEWKTFSQEVTVSNDMTDNFQSIAFNLNVDVDPNVYYFKNISIQLPNMVSSIQYTVGPSGWGTFSYDADDVKIVDAKAYAAKYNGSYIELAEVTEVPAGEGVIIEASEGKGVCAFPVIADAKTISDNGLLVSDGTIAGDGTIFVLAKKDKVGFYKLADGEKVPAGKAYLQITNTAREFIGFGAEATGIETVKTVKAEKGIFNMAGQRLVKAQKGLNIINGKKVVIK